MERELILSKLIMEQVVQFYAPRKIYRHRCACPLHNGKDNNFTIYDDSFYCWVCGAAGDLIKFVSLLFGLTYPDAMRKLDRDFRLGVYEKPTLTQHRKNRRQVEQYRRQQEEKQKQADEQFSEYLFNLKELDRYKDLKQRYAPQTEDEELHPLFVEAVKTIPYIEHLLDSYDWRCGGG
ncbi:MAG: hypothetical protein IJD80_00015 [Oscillospiraceae bacterium]|nr:hypothetical protein [Oscillospiraceae bacterium]